MLKEIETQTPVANTINSVSSDIVRPELKDSELSRNDLTQLNLTETYSLLNNNLEEFKSLHSKGYGYVRLAKYFNVSLNRVITFCRKHGIKGQPKKYSKYKYNNNFFKTIDTEAKSYYLGLIAADGCIVTKKDELSCLELSFTEEDSDILYPFRDLVAPNSPIKTYNYLKSGVYGTYKPRCILRIFSRDIMLDLISLGITPRKSLTLKPMIHNVPINLQHHFIRGYFDADGCITKSIYKNEKRCRVEILGMYDFLESLRLTINLPVGKVTPKHSSKIFKLSYHGKNRMYDIKDYLYKDATLYFDRKYQKFNW